MAFFFNHNPVLHYMHQAAAWYCNIAMQGTATPFLHHGIHSMSPMPAFHYGSKVSI